MISHFIREVSSLPSCHCVFRSSFVENFHFSVIGISIFGFTMTDISPANNVADKLASLQKEAEYLKARLEEERQKLNDVTRTEFLLFSSIFMCSYWRNVLITQFQLQLTGSKWSLLLTSNRDGCWKDTQPKFYVPIGRPISDTLSHPAKTEN